jgi:hypothetical protein
VLEIANEQNLIIDYSFSGLLDLDDITNETDAIKWIQSGMERKVVASEFFDGKFPFRMREADFLVARGYRFSVDEANDIIHWTKP